MNDEIKLSAYADDASYFMRDIMSARNLLCQVELFSKVSGLEVNRSKSECLLLTFEIDLSEYTDSFLGIPTVDNLKILGHFYDKNERVCNFHNFYGKLEKMSNVLNRWKGRNLTLFGKNLLINALSNSLFIFNAQIETPPTDFIKSAEKIHKDFLWDGTPKISHHSIISESSKGGIKYKDLNDFISAINLRKLLRMPLYSEGSHTVLPIFWIKSMFKNPIKAKDENEIQFIEFFQKSLNILDCFFQLSRKNNYNGHPFYYKALKDVEKLSTKYCENIENILSVPIWFNRYFKTKFDPEISKAGYNFLKDIFPENTQIQVMHGLTGYKSRKLKSIVDRVPFEWKTKISASPKFYVTVNPSKMLNFKGQDINIKQMRGNQMYNALIEQKTRFPRGLLKWREDFQLTDTDIKFSFTSLHSYLSSATDRVFQYKILTNILPTNEYLCRYKVLILVTVAGVPPNLTLYCIIYGHVLLWCRMLAKY